MASKRRTDRDNERGEGAERRASVDHERSGDEKPRPMDENERLTGGDERRGATRGRLEASPRRPKRYDRRRETRFVVHARQNAKLADDFSCGLRWEGPEEAVSLARYNGSSHVHHNQIEGTRFAGEFHIHKASARYIEAGLQPEGYAETTAGYTTLREALSQLGRDCGIEGIELPVEQVEMWR